MKKPEVKRLVKIKLVLMLAKRYSTASYHNGYIRFINRASMFGITLGVMALILGLSVMNGFERELKENLLSVIPDIEFESVAGVIDDWQLASQSIIADNDVVGVAPYIRVNGMVQKNEQMEAVVIHGADSEHEATVNAVPRYIYEGKWSLTSGVVIGNGLAKKLQVNVGDVIELLLPKHASNNQLGAPQYIKTKINGIYKVGGQFDFGQVYIDIQQLQTLFGWKNQQSLGIKVAITDPFQADIQARKLGAKIQEYVYVMDWYRNHGHIYRDIVMVRDIMYLVMVIVMAVACFNLVSSLTMAIQEKHSDIGILKTMGLEPARVQNVFVSMGMVIASKGVLLGAILGSFLSIGLPSILPFLESYFGFTSLNAEVYFVDTIPSQLNLWQVAVVSFTALLVAYISSLFPARRAAKLNVVNLIS